MYIFALLIVHHLQYLYTYMHWLVHWSSLRLSLGSPPRPLLGDLSSTYSTPHRLPLPSSTEALLPREEADGDGTKPRPHALDEMALQLRLKDADNKYLSEEVRKLRDNLSDKESMLSMLTEGLKEVRSGKEWCDSIGGCVLGCLLVFGCDHR